MDDTRWKAWERRCALPLGDPNGPITSGEQELFEHAAQARKEIAEFKREILELRKTIEWLGMR